MEGSKGFSTASWLSPYLLSSELKILDMISPIPQKIYSFHTFSILGKICFESFKVLCT